MNEDEMKIAHELIDILDQCLLGNEIILSRNRMKQLLDLITNLQEKLKVSQTNEETYRLEMQDITKCLGLKEDTIFDEVKEYATNLQEKYDKALEDSVKETHKLMAIRKYLKDNEREYGSLEDNEKIILGIIEGK